MRTINDNRVQSETHTHPIIVAIKFHSKPIQNPSKLLWNSYENPMKWWWNPDLRYSTIMASMAVASTCGASPWPPLLARTLGKCWGNGLKNTVWNMLGEMDWNHLKPENVETIISFQDFPGISSQLCQLSPNFVVLAPLASCSWRLAQFYCLGVMVTVLRCYSSVLVLSSWENPMGWWLSLPYTIKLWAIWWKIPWKSTIKWFYRCFFRHFGMDIGHSSHLQHHGWKRSQVPSHRLWGGQIAGFRRRNMPKSFAPGLWRDSGERLWDSPWKMVV